MGITARANRDGTTSYIVRWVDRERGARVWRSRSFRDREEAEDFWHEVATTKRRGTYRSPDALTVGEMVEDYLARGARRWQPATVATYRERARHYIVPPLGHVRLDRLTTVQVQRWVDGLDRAGLAASTIGAAHTVLSGALAEAVRLGLVARNVASGVRLPAVGGTKGQAWTAQEARAVLAEVAAQPRWHALYQVALTTGVRPGELRALRWEDVDWERASLRVRRTVAKAADGGYTVRAGTKTGPGRTVPLALPALAALRVWQKVNAGPYIFSEGQTPLRQHIWADMHARICARADVPVIRLHDLRHTAGSLLVERGVPMKVVSDLLGHKSIGTTMDVYVHVTPGALAQAAQDVAAWLNEGGEVCARSVRTEKETAS